MTIDLRKEAMMKRYPVLPVAAALVVFGACAGHDVRLSNQALSYISAGNYRQAEADLDRALAVNPDDPYALLNLGVVYHNTDRPDQARQMYERVIVLNPKEKAAKSNQTDMVGRSLGDIARNNLELLASSEAQKIQPTESPAGAAQAVLQPIARAGDQPARPLKPAPSAPAAPARPKPQPSPPAAQSSRPLAPAPTSPVVQAPPEPKESPSPAAQVAQAPPPAPTPIAPPPQQQVSPPPATQTSQLPPPAPTSVAPPQRPPSPSPSPTSAPLPRPARAGYCKSEKGESLVDVAARKQVYSDALMWPSLLRLNQEILKLAPDADILPRIELPAGTELRFVTRQEAAAERLKIGRRFWAVNVASISEERELAKLVLPLIRLLYHPYLTTAPVKGGYKRVRVGFFSNLAEAQAVGKDIQKRLGLSERPWVQQVSREEFERYAGY